MIIRSFCEILRSSKTIAVYGISDKPGRDSGLIAVRMKNVGYHVVGVSPVTKDFAGIKVYKTLEDIDIEIDIVDVFRNSKAIPELIPGVLKLKPKVLWLQLGIRNDEAVQPVIEAGIQVIQDACIAVEYNNCR